MLLQKEESIWDKVYLGIFTVVEGTAVDKYVRKAKSLLAPGEILERQVKNFYIETCKMHLKLLAAFIVLGLSVADKDFWVFLSVGYLLCLCAPFWDLKQKLHKRSSKLSEDFDAMLLKLFMYMGAGITLRNSFEKVVRDLERGEKNRALTVEMRFCLNQLTSGVPETESYYRFGQRCGLPEYVRLGGLMAQNVQRGNAELLLLLETEMKEAGERRRHHIRREGDKVSTKLLGPMMLLLAMVLFMIMVPAFGNL